MNGSYTDCVPRLQAFVDVVDCRSGSLSHHPTYAKLLRHLDLEKTLFDQLLLMAEFAEYKSEVVCQHFFA